MNADRQLLGEPRRQSPIAVAFLALRALRRVGLAQLAVLILFVTRLPVAALFTIIPIVGLAVLGFSVLAWWRFTFTVTDGELRVTKGVLSQDRLTVPLERVQTVSIEQGPVHRIIGLVNVAVDTAGATDAEFTIDAVERSVAEALQRVVADNSTRATTETSDGDGQPTLEPGMLPPPTIPPIERRLLQRSARRLLLTGLTRPSFAGLAFLVPVFAFGDEIISTIGLDFPDVDGPDPALWMLWLVPVAVVIGTLVGFVANLLQIVLTEWNLSLSLRERGLLREAGLISRRSTSTTIDRIQRIEVRQNPLEARVGIQRVSLPTIGDGDLHLPGTDDSELAELRTLVIDADAHVDVMDRRISPQAVFLATRNTAIFAVLLAAGLFVPLGPPSLLALGLIPLAWWSAQRRNRLHRWGLATYGVAQHHEFVSVRTEQIMLRKVNGAAIRQSLFERKRGLATVHLQTAEGGIAIGMLPLDEARAVRDRALMVAETNTKAWM